MTITHEPRRRVIRRTPYAKVAQRIAAAMKRCGAVRPEIEGERGDWTVSGWMFPEQAAEFMAWADKYRVLLLVAAMLIAACGCAMRSEFQVSYERENVVATYKVVTP
jgi:hypothetical protein